MKRLYPLIFLFFLAGCIKQKKEDMVINAMVNGRWTVTNFNKGGTDMTSDFFPYQFQFKTNFTVEAFNNGNLEKTGSWDADAAAQTISSYFTNATNPLALLNGIWKITNNSWTWVEAQQTIGGEVMNLRLDKQ